MTYLRIVKNKATTIIFDRTFLEDKRLGLAERGLLAWLLQQANGTRLHIKDLKRQLPDTKMHIDTALLALRCARYILSIPVSFNGQVSYTEYHVYERPQVTEPDDHACTQHITLVDDNQHPVGTDANIESPFPLRVCPLQTITKRLSLTQTLFIDQVAAHLHQRCPHQAGMQDWQKSLRVAMLDKNSLPTLHPNFFKKLTGLKASAIAGHWFPYHHKPDHLQFIHTKSLPHNGQSTESFTC